MNKKALLSLVLPLCVALPVFSGSKYLKPQPTTDQQAMMHRGKYPFISQSIDGITAIAAVEQTNKETFTAWIAAMNSSGNPITIEQERFFLLNAYDKALYRFSDYELRESTLAWADMPPPPPPPPRRYYTITGTSIGSYTLNPLGFGYYSLNGFSTQFYQVQEHYDYWGVIGAQIGATINQILNQREARKYIEWLDANYFTNRVLESSNRDEWATQCVQFKAHYVSSRLPVTLVLDIEGTQFRFEFGKVK
jgi:hypothetical protein